MKSLIIGSLSLLFIAIVCLSFSLVWLNRGSDAVVGLMIKVAAPILVAAGLVGLEIFSGESVQRWSVKPLFLINSESRLVALSMPIGLIDPDRAAGYETFESAWTEFTPDATGDLRPWLARGFWSWMEQKYSIHWDVDRLSFRGVGRGVGNVNPSEGAELNPFKYRVMGFSVALPSGTKVESEDSEDGLLIVIRNSHTTLSVRLKHAGSSRGLSETRLAQQLDRRIAEDGGSLVSHHVELGFEAKYSPWVRWSPETQRQQRWVEEIRVLMTRELDWDGFSSDLEDGLGAMANGTELPLLANASRE